MHAVGTTASRLLQGVDFLDFVRRKEASPASGAGDSVASADKRRLYVPGLHPRDFDHHAQRAKDYLTALFSLSTLNDATYTVVTQRNPNTSTRTPSGFNPANDYLDII